MANLKTILTNSGKREAVAAPVGSEGAASSGAFNAGAALPAGSVPIDGGEWSNARQGTEIFRQLYAVNGPFEEPWMRAFNAEVWQTGQPPASDRAEGEGWKNDATGWSYDE